MNPQTYEQKIPFSEDAEKAVLGTVLRHPDSMNIIESNVRADHFFIDVNRQIFQAMIDLSAAQQSVDLITLADKLRAAPQQKINLKYLVDLMEASPISQNVEHYCQIVRNDFYRRKIVDACQRTIQGATSFSGTIDSYIENVEKEFLAISAEHDRKGIISGRTVLDTTIEEIEKRLARQDEMTGIVSGFSELDKTTGGFQRSDLIILAARPGMGKTALVLNCAANAAKKGSSVVVFTLEMTKEQLMSRVLSSESRVDSSRLRRGDLTEDEEDRLAQGARNVYQLSERLGIDETPGISLMELRSRARRYKKEFGLDLIIIDYLQLMSAGGMRKTESREREISEISMGLKNLAKELAVPVIALAQLNRGPDARPDKRPKMSDLRESGSMEQDADLILFVYRDEYYNPSSQDIGIAELQIAKNRHGSTGTIKLAFQPNFVSFQNLFKEGRMQT